ncbi:EscS/YscS/HrcS family type III secretion system export apparatus protein [Thermodesulfomicrobium sp. WS]|uniref:type III secretion system export apparatus subunit SctS n=1 Tax=Thermodesulfomicrobium sp. WS TaxID=3004129 RepID=UPI0024900BCC|nr:type III secretion system export apparatus subunit SctS [Thermodesulfomicrobium sp. WS]BDV01967.1 EscS/YscS/HrcS family type III secretion system export apparatus protein [Thermodesulfomicrobium sp. WS]
MVTPSIMEFTKNALILVLLLSLPAIIVASLVGLLVSLIQALTQIQEQTLSFAIKLIAVIATVLFTARWVGSEMFTYALRIFDLLPVLGR